MDENQTSSISLTEAEQVYLNDNNDSNSESTSDNTKIWNYYDYTNNSYNNHFFKNTNGTNWFSINENGIPEMNGFGLISELLYYGFQKDISYNQMGKQWEDYGSSYASAIKSVWSKEKTLNPFDSNFWTGENAANLGLSIGNVALVTLESGIRGIGLGASQLVNVVYNNGSEIMENIESKISEIFGGISTMSNNLGDVLNTIGDSFNDSNGGSVITGTIGKALNVLAANFKNNYIDGVTETSYGRTMESTWSKSSNGFLSLIGKKVVFNNSTPFDSGSDMSNLYGNMILGVPPIFTNIADPKNRTLTNNYMRDLRFVSITPGFPQYRGSNVLSSGRNDQLQQTTDGNSQLQYLLKNGLDSDSLSKDRRYYTFKPAYEEYYSYLETMQNALWIKMGLSDTPSGMHSIFTYFDNPTEDSRTLKSQYQSPIGFATNEIAYSESMSNNQTSIGDEYASNVNSASQEYQRLNYLTGMGTGSALANARAKIAKTSTLTRGALTYVKQTASNFISALSSGEVWYLKLLSAAKGAVSDVLSFNATHDVGADIQQLSTTNGMQVVYPELWASSGLARSCNITLKFVSPYGDPESIFHYVMAPLAAIMCFAMPRQADANGFVSPFFIRADVPGVFTSDLAMISNIMITRGGSDNVWTKDGLPREVEVSFDIYDLYNYLAMTKRLSFLSANPSYTTWLDSLASLHAVNTNETDNAMNDYWKAMLNRVSGGEAISNGVYNKYSNAEKYSHTAYAAASRKARIGRGSNTKSSNSWLRGIK